MTDRVVVQLVIGVLGAVALLLAIPLGIVVVLGHEVDPSVLALLSAQLGAAIGALSALLAHTSSTPPEPPLDDDAGAGQL